MSTKYQTAYCDTLGQFISVAEAEQIEMKRPVVYKEKIFRHLWCPACGQVMLVLVHRDGERFFRGHPRQMHGENCPYLLPVCKFSSVEDLVDADKNNLERIGRQIQRLLQYTGADRKAQKTAKTSLSAGSESVISQTNRHRPGAFRLPEKRIDLPLTPDDLSVTKIFYGKVLLISTDGHGKSTNHYFTLLSTNNHKKICTISATAKVWHYLCRNPLLQNGRRVVHIAFCGEIKQSSKDGGLYCTLLRSQLLAVQAVQ